MSLPERFAQLPPEPAWTFEECGPAQTGYITHRYHRYPAKFIPQLAARLIADYSSPGQTVLDPFMGSGTTLVEALVAGRRALGLDINLAALIAARAKTTPIEPSRLQAALSDFFACLAPLEGEGKGLFDLPEPLLPPDADRLDWWFPPEQQRRLGIVLAAIEEVRDRAVRDFLRCGFSHCLKAASFWLMRSSKPTRDKRKLADGVPHPIPVLRSHLSRMERGNRRFWELLPEEARDGRITADIRRGDARQLPWGDGSVGLVVTSPPYVTSYEYADLHELTTLWLGWLEGTAGKDEFIGSSAARARGEAEPASELARAIADRLTERDAAKAREVSRYFFDMQLAFAEAHRALAPGGCFCDVIGNTALKGVEILNAEVHAELLQAVGFEIETVIRRVIPSKTLPQVRDPRTGKFTTADNAGAVEAYPEEFIIIARKR